MVCHIISRFGLAAIIIFARPVHAEEQVVKAEKRKIPVYEASVGTVQSQRRVVVSAQISGQVISVKTETGQSVAKDEVVIELDDREVRARYEQASAQYDRIKGFLERKAATAEQMENAEAQFIQAKAALSYTRIRAPITGVVSEKTVEPGDLAWPGRSLLVLYDPSALRLEAQVREGLAKYLNQGAKYKVQLPALGREVEGILSEVVPSADPASRSFDARVNFESMPNVFPGMFGRLEFAIGEREAIVAPSAAITNVGQLPMVNVKRADGFERRLVTVGEEIAPGISEILSGLNGSESLIIPSAETKE